MPSSTRRHAPCASIHKPCSIQKHFTDREPPGLLTPVFRGFRLACVAGEIEKLKRDIDDYWAARYLAEGTPAGRVGVLMEERNLRHNPREWTAKAHGEAVNAL